MDNFIFKLSPQTENAPMPKNAEGKELKQITISGESAKSFGKIIFDKPGQYDYQIHELAGSNTNYTYDSSIYTMTVFVTKLNEKLETVTILKKGTEGAKCDEIVFRNTYKNASEKQPVTRDTANVQMYIVLIILMGGFLRYLSKKKQI